jgi:hypothetical protein
MSAAPDVLTFCTMRALEQEEGHVAEFRQLADPVTHRHDITAKVRPPYVDMITGAPISLFEASFIPTEPGRTRVELRQGTSAYGGHKIAAIAWSHIERCANQGGQKKNQW